MNRTTLFGAVLGIIKLVAGDIPALADDFQPPPWRNSNYQYSTVQAWDFLTPDNPVAPDDPTLPLVVGDGGGSPSAEMLAMVWGNGAWAGASGNFIVPGLMGLRVPDWINPKPVSRIRVQITYGGSEAGSTAPQIGGITGEDSQLGIVTGAPIGPPVIVPLNGRLGLFQDWEIRPNPNWELIFIGVPNGIFVDQIVVDTMSVPEPSALILVAIGCFVWRFGRARVSNRRKLMRLRISPCVVLVAVCLLFPMKVSATVYDFVRIADSSGSYSDFSRPTINSVGTAAFRARLDTGGVEVVTGSGGPIATIANSSGPLGSLFGYQPAINSAGTVAFDASFDAGGRGVFAGNGGSLVTIADDSGPFNSSFGGWPSINAAGTVAFLAGLDAGGYGIFTGSGGPTITLYDHTSPFNSFSEPAINAAGTVAFAAVLDAGGYGIFTGSGGPTTTIADDSGQFSSFGFLVSINDAGTVAFRAGLDSGGSGVFAGSGGLSTTIADTSGPYNSFGIDVSINNGGKVAFNANLDSGGNGIFTGPDPLTDKVIKSGDPLDGSTVTFALISQYGLNDSGELAIAVDLADGRFGIYRASPAAVPEPSAAFLAMCGLVTGLGLAPRRLARSFHSSGAHLGQHAVGEIVQSNCVYGTL